MSIAWAGLLTGYDGHFPFEKPGDQYDDSTYIGMRVVRKWEVILLYFLSRLSDSF